MSDFVKYNNPWSSNDSVWFNEGANRWLHSEFTPPQNELNAVTFHDLVSAAEFLGGQDIIMRSYFKFQKNIYHWFFSPNPHLKSATAKPKKFNSWSDWNKFSTNVKKILGNIAGYNANVTNLGSADKDLKKLINAYKYWNPNLYGIFWADKSGEGSYMCNIFVGDAIYLYTKKSMTNSNNHYFGPDELFAGKSPLRRIEPSEVGRNTIAVMLSGIHVEIITEIKTYVFETDGFCSIGAGRMTLEETGAIKCDNFEGVRTREVANDSNDYYVI